MGVSSSGFIIKLANSMTWAPSNVEENEAGFTLIELLLTIMVLGIVIASMTGLYYLMQVTQTKTAHYDLAVRAARSEIEDLRNYGYATLTPGSTINFSSSLPNQLPSNKSGTVTISEPATGLRRVDVTIAYSEYGANTTIELSSDIGFIGLGIGH